MFRWYKNADTCYAYLADVASGPEVDMHPSYARVPSNFGQSRWFTRGWTLQELIAPKQVVFYSRGWENIGTKEGLCSLLEEITRINQEVIRTGDIELASVADKMAWAANRKTTRIEDTAYSLLGLFDVNIPLLYGEGKRAFRRLQEEILRTSNDQSLFAWSNSGSIFTLDDYPTHLRDVEKYGERQIIHNIDASAPLQGLLADSPAAFGNIGSIESFQEWPTSHGEPPRIHSGCVYINLPELPQNNCPNLSFAVITCSLWDNNDHILGIPFRRWGSVGNSGRLPDLVSIPIARFRTGIEGEEILRRDLKIKPEPARSMQNAQFRLGKLVPVEGGYESAPKIYLYRGAKYGGDRMDTVVPTFRSNEPQAILYFDSESRSRFAVVLYWTGRVGAASTPIPREAIVTEEYLETYSITHAESHSDYASIDPHDDQFVMLEYTNSLGVYFELEGLPWRSNVHKVNIFISSEYGKPSPLKYVHE
jgi:hypothetical protein